MAPIDGAIGMKININLPQTTYVKISKDQPSKACGLGGVVFLRSKSAPILYKYSQPSAARCPLLLSCDDIWTLTGPAHPSGGPWGAPRAGGSAELEY